MIELFEIAKETLMSHIQENQFLSGGILLGALGGGFAMLKGIPFWIWSRVKRKITFTFRVEQTTTLYWHLNKYLIHKHPESLRTVNARYEGEHMNHNGVGHESLDKDDSTGDIRMEQLDDVFVVWRGIMPIHVSKGREKMENASSVGALYFDRFTLSGIFAKKRILKFVKEVVDYNMEIDKKVETLRIWDYNKGYGWRSVNQITPKTMDSIFFDKGVKEDIIEECERFSSSRDWYVDRGIPYKRGILLEGPPGNGKTSLCLALSKHLDRDIYFLGLNGLTDKELKDAFQGLDKDSLLVLEDIDAAFNKRKGKAKLAFSTILNCLDGAFFKEGVITIMTTNHPEKLDPAMARPGRVDLKISIPNPSPSTVADYVSVFFGENVVRIPESCESSMASVQGFCMNSSSADEVIDIIERKVELIKEEEYEGAKN